MQDKQGIWLMTVVHIKRQQTVGSVHSSFPCFYKCMPYKLRDFSIFSIVRFDWISHGGLCSHYTFTVQLRMATLGWLDHGTNQKSGATTGGQSGEAKWL
jgi:hypothetical protein